MMKLANALSVLDKRSTLMPDICCHLLTWERSEMVADWHILHNYRSQGSGPHRRQTAYLPVPDALQLTVCHLRLSLYLASVVAYGLAAQWSYKPSFCVLLKQRLLRPMRLFVFAQLEELIDLVVLPKGVELFSQYQQCCGLC